MSYGSRGLNDWMEEALRIATEHGFKDASIGEDIALMHSELSEALEDYRNGCGPTEIWYENAEGARMVSSHPQTSTGLLDLEHPYKPRGIPSEMADAIIRVLHFAGKHGINIEQAVREKMMYNESRPFKHGGKKL